MFGIVKHSTPALESFKLNLKMDMESMKTSKKIMFVKTAFEMTMLKKKKKTLFTNVNQFTFVHGSFLGYRRARHTYCNLPWPSTTTRLQMWGFSFDTWGLKNYSQVHRAGGHPFIWNIKFWSDFMVPQNH